MLRTKQILDFVNDVQSAMSSINSTQDTAIGLNTDKETNVTTDLSYTAAPAKGTVVSSDGNDAVLPLADATNAGLLSPAEKVAIENSATDAELSDAIAQEVIDRNLAIKTTDDRVTTLLAGSEDAIDTFGEIKGFIDGLSQADVTIIANISTNTLKETNVTTDLRYVAAPAKGTVVSSDGTDAVLPLADATNAGLLSPAEKQEIADNTIKVGISVEQAEKLAGIEAKATADQTDAEIRAAVEAASDSNVFTDADHTKLNEIEAKADVTDSVNVEAAGALMDSEVANLSEVKAFSSADYATADQGVLADSALQDASAFDSSGSAAAAQEAAVLESTRLGNLAYDRLGDAAAAEGNANDYTDGFINALGTAAYNATGDFATAAQGILADAAATEADLTLAEARILALEGDIEGFSFDSAEVVGSDIVTAVQGGSFKSKTATFQVDANDELDVFVNGLQVHRAIYGGEVAKAAAEGWVSDDGINFIVQNLGYSIDADDHIIISGKLV